MLKKIWKNEEAVSPVIAVILMVAITVVLAAVLYVWAQSFAGGDEGFNTIAWKITVKGDTYLIDIIDVDTEKLDEVSFSILDENRLVAYWEDPSAQSIQMKGDMTDVNFSQSDYDAARETNSGHFYNVDPIAGENMNKTLCIVFMDSDLNGKLSSGDSIWIRSLKKGGVGEEGFLFRMNNDRVQKQYGELELITVN